ncbi:MAG: Phosphoserine phosphatase [Cellulomonadaceae bacterium TMED98]|nr:MAG: Phosphoserine phosphatase [Cellulomonadaceae bacterium TMED98]
MSADHRFLVVMDVDSTLINEEGLDEIARVVSPEIAQKIADVTARAMAGELDFAGSLTERVALLQGVSRDVITQASHVLSVTPGARELIRAVHDAGGRVCAVSGGFHELIDPIAEALGLDKWRANRFGVDGGYLTGRVDGAIVDGEAKKAALGHWAARWQIPHSHTVAIGDGANDIPMLEAAGVSIGFCAKPAVQEVTDHEIEERDLARVLPLIGLD